MVGALPTIGNEPLYVRFQTLLRDAIDHGVLKPDQALPGERELSFEFGLSRITVRKALAGLVSEQKMVSRQGVGTFVAGTPVSDSSRVEKNFSKLSSFSEDMRARGMVPSSEWLSRSSGTVTPGEALALVLSPGTAVHRFRRVRFADNRPMAVEHSTTPGFCFNSADAVDVSLYEALNDAGFCPQRALQRLRALVFDAEICAQLGVEEGHAGLLIERRSFLAEGTPIELTVSYYRGDCYDFVAELAAT